MAPEVPELLGRKTIVLGADALTPDVCAVMGQASDEFDGTAAGRWEGGRSAPETEIALHEPGADRALFELIQEIGATDVVVLARSASPGRPERTGRYDAAIASNVASAVGRAVRAGIVIEHLLCLSATAVYGLARSGPARFREDSGHTEHGRPGSAYAAWVEDLREAEAAYRLLAHQTGLPLTLLRAAPVVAGPIESLVTDYLEAPLAIRCAGYDPPVQVLHYRDLVAAVCTAIDERPGKTINVVGRGLVTLSRLGALGGKVSCPLPSAIADRLAPRSFAMGPLTMRCVADGSLAAEEISFQAQFSAEEALSV